MQSLTVARRNRPEKIGRRLYEYTGEDGRPSYFADVVVNGKQRRIKLEARNRTEARKAQTDLLSKHGRGEVPAPTRRSVQEVADEFLAAFERRVAAGERGTRTAESYRWRLESRVLPVLGNRPIQKVQVEDIARMIQEWRDRGDSAGTILSVRTPLSRLFKFAQRRGYVTSNPLERLEADEWPRVTRGEKRILSLDEIRALIAKASDGSRPLIATLALSGLRQSEALALTWQDIDLQGRAIHVRYQLARGAGGERVSLKTDGSRRSVTLHPGLRDVLAAHKAQAFRRGLAKPEDYVFATASGRPWGHRNAARAVYSAAEKAGIDGLKTHDLRHGFASWLIGEGVDPVRVSRQLGHSTAAFTMSVYAHEFEQAEHAERLQERLAQSGFGRVLDGN